MSKMNSKRKNWLKKKFRSKKSLGDIGRHPRLVVFRSNKHFYSQLIDDNNNLTILSASTLEKTFDKNDCKNKIDVSKKVGVNIAEKIKKNKIDRIIFDRNGYLYHGRVKAFADAVREKGVII